MSAALESWSVLGPTLPTVRVWTRSIAGGDLWLCSSPSSSPANIEETISGWRTQCELACREAVLRPNSVLQVEPPARLQGLRLLVRPLGDQRWRLYCEVTGESHAGLNSLAMSGLAAALLVLCQQLHRIGFPAQLHQQILLEETHSGPNTPIEWLDEQEREWFKPRRPQRLNGQRCAVVVLSDRAADGRYADRSGPILIEGLRQLGADVADYAVLADDPPLLQAQVRRLCEEGTRLCLLSGGTGLGPRDCTPDALQSMGLREVAGFGEAFRHGTASLTPLSWLSRATAFQMERMLLLVLPGSPRAVTEGWDVWRPLLAHALAMADGGTHQ